MKPLNVAYDAVQIELSREELRTLVHAMMEVTLTSVIVKGDFEARIGVGRQRVDKMLDELSEIWKQATQSAYEPRNPEEHANARP